MRKRVVEVIDSDGKSVFRPQFKFIFWWNYLGIHNDTLEFDNYEDAVKYAAYNSDVKRKVHSICSEQG